MKRLLAVFMVAITIAGAAALNGEAQVQYGRDSAQSAQPMDFGQFSSFPDTVGYAWAMYQFNIINYTFIVSDSSFVSPLTVQVQVAVDNTDSLYVDYGEKRVFPAPGTYSIQNIPMSANKYARVIIESGSGIVAIFAQVGVGTPNISDYPADARVLSVYDVVDTLTAAGVSDAIPIRGYDTALFAFTVPATLDSAITYTLQGRSGGIGWHDLLRANSLSIETSTRQITATGTFVEGISGVAMMDSLRWKWVSGTLASGSVPILIRK
jgi:hypothetical protein